MKSLYPRIAAAGPAAEILCQAEPIEWLAAADSQADGPKRFSTTAYTGGAMRVEAYSLPVIVDVAGVAADAQVPMLLHHDRTQIVGHGEPELSATRIKVAGVISGGGAAAQEVLTAAAKGFPWKSSIGLSPQKVEYVAEGASAKANGRTFKGPCQIVRAGVLKEVSFLPIPADPNSSVQVAASAAQECFTMPTFEQWLQAAGYEAQVLNDKQKTALRKVYDRDAKFHEWLQAQGFDPAQITDAQRPTLRASFEAAEPILPAPIAAAAAGNAPTPPAQAGSQPAGQSASGQQPPVQAAATTDDYLREQAEQSQRVGRIRQICAGRHADIEARAIQERWTAEKTELEVWKLDKPTGPAIHGSGPAPDARILECAMLMAVAHPEKMLLAGYGEQILERAHRFRRVRFKEAIHLCCAIDGRQTPSWDASDNELIKAAFSTVSLPGILSNVGHKVMLAAYTAVPALADRLCRVLSASDFKTHTGYRLSGDFKLDEVGADGELKHAKVDESSYTYRVKTYGRIFGLTRQMQINDDLGAFAEIPRMIGRGAALTKERLFWELVLANTGSFFHADNANLITKVLGSEGMKLAVKALEEQTDEQGDPILLMGRYVVVPPALRETADELYSSLTFNTGGGSSVSKVASRNIYAGRYEPQTSPYLGNTSFHASASSTGWYLWGEPADVAAFGVAYLNGQSQPVVEDVALSGEFLGNAWRGYLDFGVCQIDHRGAVKSTGLVS